MRKQKYLGKNNKEPSLPIRGQKGHQQASTHMGSLCHPDMGHVTSEFQGPLKEMFNRPSSERNLRLNVSLMSLPQLTLIYKHHFLITRASSLRSGTLDQRSRVQSIKGSSSLTHITLGSGLLLCQTKRPWTKSWRGSTDVTGIWYENILNNCKISVILRS